MLWDRGQFALVNLALKVKFVLTKWRLLECGQGNPGKEKDCVFGFSLKIGFRPIWPRGRRGKQSEGVRQADNLELKSWLIYRLPVSMLPRGAEWHQHGGAAGARVWVRGCRNEGSRRGGRWETMRESRGKMEAIKMEVAATKRSKKKLKVRLRYF